MDRQLSNFLLKGGRLLDPASGRDGLFDVRVRDGVIDAIGTNLPVHGITVIDVKDLLVTPGLIDVHLHLMKGLGAFGVDPDIFGVGSGVTTVVDAAARGILSSMCFAITSRTTPKRACSITSTFRRWAE